MISIPAPLQAHYDGETTTTAHLLKLTRPDGYVIGLTSASSSMTIDGVTYDAAHGLSVSSVATSAGLDVDNLELTSIDDGTIFTRVHVLGGLWQNTAFLLSRYNWADPSNGVEPILAGTLGQVQLKNGLIVAEMRGLQQFLQQTVGNVTSRTCRARLADYPQPAGKNLCRLSPAAWIDSPLAVTSVIDDRTFYAPVSGGVSDASYSSVVLLLHMEGADASTAFTDSGPGARTVNAVGTAKLTTTSPLYGVASGSFDGSGHLILPYASAWAFTNGLYTVEISFSMPAIPSSEALLIGQNDYGSYGEWDLRIRTDGKVYFTSPTGSTILQSSTISTNTRYRVALTDDGTTSRLFLDGVLQGSSSTRAPSSTRNLSIGAGANGTARLTGKLDEVRITKGVCRYTATYTPSTTPFANSASVSARPDDWFGEGLAVWLSGGNTNLMAKIRSCDGSGLFGLMLPMPAPIQTGDTLLAIAGCRKRRDEDCKAKFNNVLNFQGEPDLPGVDALTANPDVSA